MPSGRGAAPWGPRRGPSSAPPEGGCPAPISRLRSSHAPSPAPLCPSRQSSSTDERKEQDMHAKTTVALLVALVGVATLTVAAQAGRFSAWEPAQKIDEIAGNSPELNTPDMDGCPIQSPDGRSLYMASTRPGGMGLLDIWVARRSNRHAPWGAPENLGEPVNSAADDFCPTPIRGGGLFFVSREVLPGSCGLGDIYFTRYSRTPGWSEPQHLGCAPEGPNSSLDEQGPSYVKAGRKASLYFSRSSATVPGDIYVSKGLAGRGFGPAKPVAELNDAIANDIQPNVRKDGGGDASLAFERRANAPLWARARPGGHVGHLRDDADEDRPLRRSRRQRDRLERACVSRALSRGADSAPTHVAGRITRSIRACRKFRMAPAGVEPAHADSKPQCRTLALQGKPARHAVRAPLCAPFPRRTPTNAFTAALQPSTPPLPFWGHGNRSQATATVFACLSRSGRRRICHRLPTVAPDARGFAFIQAFLSLVGVTALPALEVVDKTVQGERVCGGAEENCGAGLNCVGALGAIDRLDCAGADRVLDVRVGDAVAVGEATTLLFVRECERELFSRDVEVAGGCVERGESELLEERLVGVRGLEAAGGGGGGGGCPPGGGVGGRGR